MIKFQVSPFEQSWEVSRNDRLICYLHKHARAVELAQGYADCCNRRGREAFVVLSNKPITRRFGVISNAARGRWAER